MSQERDALVKKLVEAEMGAKSTSDMVLKLKDTVNKLNEVSSAGVEKNIFLFGTMDPMESKIFFGIRSCSLKLQHALSDGVLWKFDQNLKNKTI